MSEPVITFCAERIIPPEYRQLAIAHAIAENAANASPFETAAERSKLWKPGRTLRVRFLDGTAEAHALVARYARQWCDHANIALDFGDHAQAEIRIAFSEASSWSAIGTDALVAAYFPAHAPTMNFGWIEEAVVLHEFGHALGLIHEHQSPAQAIQWDEAAVIAHLAGPPNFWSEERTRANVFERYAVAQTQFSAFDSSSIMLYYFPPQFTRNGQVFTQNKTLSEQDRRFIAACYPKA